MRAQRALSGALWKEEWCLCWQGAALCQNTTADGGMCSAFIVGLNPGILKNKGNLRIFPGLGSAMNRSHWVSATWKALLYPGLSSFTSFLLHTPRCWREILQVRHSISKYMEGFFFSAFSFLGLNSKLWHCFTWSFFWWTFTPENPKISLLRFLPIKTTALLNWVMQRKCSTSVMGWDKETYMWMELRFVLFHFLYQAALAFDSKGLISEGLVTKWSSHSGVNEKTSLHFGL